LDNIRRIPSSFRDPDGFVFVHAGEVYRAIHEDYVETFNQLRANGLYDELIGEDLMIPFSIEECLQFHIPDHPIVIKPYQISYITYPYEWSAEQLTDAAICTLRAQQISIKHGFHLKDATPFNVQFVEGKPKLIDTLSFYGPARGSGLWTAYRQFCEAFLAPLSLAAFVEGDLSRLSRIYLDGVPLRIASKLLPLKSWLSPGILVHVHLNSRSQRDGKSKRQKQRSSVEFSPEQELGLVTNLRGVVNSLSRRKSVFGWTNYYGSELVNRKYLENKLQIVTGILSTMKLDLVLDVGTNTGVMAQVASKYSGTVVALDRDPVSIGQLYSAIKKGKIRNIIPLVVDILNPTPSLGWMNNGRASFVERVNPDLIMLLGILHHLLSQANINFSKLLELCELARKYLIIEYIPQNDPNYKALFAKREKNFGWYTEENLVGTLQTRFNIIDVKEVQPTNRRIMLLEKK